MSENNQREKQHLCLELYIKIFFEKIIDQNLWRVIVNCGFRAIETFDYGDYLGFIQYFPLFFYFEKSWLQLKKLFTHSYWEAVYQTIQ